MKPTREPESCPRSGNHWKMLDCGCGYLHSSVRNAPRVSIVDKDPAAAPTAAGVSREATP